MIRDVVIGAAIVQLNGFIPYEESKPIFQHQYDMIRFYKLKKCLIDLSEIKIIDNNSQNEIQKNWVANVKKEGVKHVAVVVPKNIFGKASSENVNNQIKSNDSFEIREFSDIEKAKEWLNAKNN